MAGGFAYLWMRIDPRVALDNMWERRISGTTDWARYDITLPLNPSKTRHIVVGALLNGKGKMWLDDLSVTVDGGDISEAKIFESQLPPVPPVDREFDKSSGIEFPSLTPQQIGGIELLGRVWGFLKYHHPAVASGEYDWDYELFRVLGAC